MERCETCNSWSEVCKGIGVCGSEKAHPGRVPSKGMMIAANFPCLVDDAGKILTRPDFVGCVCHERKV